MEVGRAPVKAFEPHHIGHQSAEAEQDGVEHEQVAIPQMSRQVEAHGHFQRIARLN
jgi:hypothetical protein